MRSRVRTWALLTGLLFIVSGCAGQTGLQFTGAGGPYQARTAADQIQVFDKDPGGRPYATIGHLGWEYTSNTVLVVLKDVLPKLKEKAAEVGGDGIIVREAGYSGAPSPTKAFQVSADVIRWQP